MKTFSNNQELREYLTHLSAELEKRRRHDLSEAVLSASKQLMPTEFLGESRIALRHVLDAEGGVLSILERRELSNALKQLDDCFDKRAADSLKQKSPRKSYVN